MKAYFFLTVILLYLSVIACNRKDETMSKEIYPVRLITLNPGHFHAALVQKKMYRSVDPVVYVYGPYGSDIELHLQKIEQYNSREDKPTSWEEIVYQGPDYFEKMLSEKAGNVVTISGKNNIKAEYILRSLQSGFNVLADKPMVINAEDFDVLKKAFEISKEEGIHIYDIMTERFEITSILQKELSHKKEIFGELQKGSIDNPAVTKESVHHFFKYVSGNPLTRPSWFFDVEQQGEGIIDVSTHLVDLIQWACFPEQIIDYLTDVRVEKAERWATELNESQFQKVTGLTGFPDYLMKDVEDKKLKVFSNGSFIYQIKSVFARVAVTWNFQAPEGTGDTHCSIMRGSRANLVISQQEEEDYIPTLYIEFHEVETGIDSLLRRTVEIEMQEEFPGLGLENLNGRKWKLHIPAEYRVGHEAHFGQVVDQYLDYLQNDNMPEWEVPNMLAKYYLTTSALQLAKLK